MPDGSGTRKETLGEPAAPEAGSAACFWQIWLVWLLLSVVSGVFSVRLAAGEGRVPLAESAAFEWLLQVPAILAVALVHTVSCLLAGRLHHRIAAGAGYLVGLVLVFFFVLFYSASHSYREDVGSYLSPDLLLVAGENLRQLVPDLVRGRTGYFAALLAVSAVIPLLSVRSPRTRFRGVLRGLGMGSLFLVAAGSAMSWGVLWPDRPRLVKMKDGLLPTSSLVVELVDSRWLAMTRSITPRDLPLIPKVSSSEYAAAHPLGARRHVIVVMLESVPWDAYEVTGYHRRGVTPNIDAFAEQCLVFPRTYAVSNHSNYAQTSVHASQYPLRGERLDFFDRIDYPKDLLSDLLAAHGYETAFFSAQNEDWQGMRRFLLSDSGFDHFHHSEQGGIGSWAAIEREVKLPDSVVMDSALELLEERDWSRPLFLYVNLQNTHFPYNPQDGAEPLFSPWSTEGMEYDFTSYDRERIAVVRNRFDNALHHVDRQVGRLLDDLKERGVLDDSIVLITADHGEAFYEHGRPTHGTTLFDTQVRVTSLFRLPGGVRAGTREDVISSLDLAPSVLQALELPDFPGFQGRPVLESPRKGPVFLVSHGLRHSLGIVSGGFKYFRYSDGDEVVTKIGSGAEVPVSIPEVPAEELQGLRALLHEFESDQLYYYQMMSSASRRLYHPPQPVGSGTVEGRDAGN